MITQPFNRAASYWVRVAQALLVFGVLAAGLVPHEASAQAPRVVRTLDDLTLVIDSGEHYIDLRGVYWGAPEKCEAESSDESVATVRLVDGYDLYVTPVGIGDATINLTATNEFGSVEHDFGVEVVHVAPTAVGAFPDYEMRVGDVLPLQVSGAFTGDALTYTAISSADDMASVSVTDSTASITAHAAGMANITVTATNTGGSAEQTIGIWIFDVPPAPVGELPDVTMTIGDTPITVDVAEAFSGSALTFSASSSASDMASVSIDGSTISISAHVAGTATVTATATNSEGSAEQSFDVIVKDVPPAPVGELADITMTIGDEPVSVDVANAFSGTALSFAAMSSASDLASVSIDGSTITVSAHVAGMATVTATATNTEGSADQTFVVTVKDVPPMAGSLPDIALTTGGEAAVVDAAAAFTGTALVYSVEGSGDAVSVSLAGSHVTVAPLVEGEATITVTAANSEGMASTSFRAMVSTDAAELDALENTVAALARSTLASVTSAIGGRFRAERMAPNEAGGANGFASPSAFAPSTTNPFAGFLNNGMQVGGSYAAYPQGAYGPTNTSPQLGAGFGASYSACCGGFSNAAPMGYGRSMSSNGLHLLNGMSFALPMNAAASGSGAWVAPAEWTFWGQVDRQSFDGAGYDGDLTSLYVGADANFGDTWLAGLAISRSSGDADYEFSSAHASGTGDIDSEMVSVLPYVRWSVDELSEFWAIAGVGWGDIDLERSATAQESEADLSMWMLSAGGRRTLNSGDGWNVGLIGDAGILEMQTDGGVGIVDDMNVSVSRVKFAVEGERFISSGGGETVSIFGQIGGRHDSGDGDTGTGVELMGGIRVNAAARLSVEAKARLLSLHSADDYEENGVSVSAIIHPRSDGSGMSLAVSSYLGAGMSANNYSLEQGYGYPGRIEDFGPETDAWGMDARIGYAVPVLQLTGLLTPFAAFDMAGNDGHGMRMGLRYDLADQGDGTMFNLEFTGGQEYDRWRREANNMVQLRGELRF